jgi:hypothetical protein
MALAAFQSDQQALDFLYGGPVADPQLDIAPEAPVEMELGPDRLVQAADAAFLNDLDARGEPPLPTPEGGGDQRLEISDLREDEPLPPVVPAGQQGAAFASDEEALAFLSAGAEERRVETPRPTLEAEQTSGPGFGSDAEALAFLQGAEQRAPEIKLPAPRPVTTPKPVTTPEAADGTDVTFDAKGPAFQFTGSLVVDPSSGPEQGLDGMVPAAARGPVATMPGQAEPVLNRRPRLVPSEGGQIVFDQSSPERFTQGVEEAFAAGILPQSNYEKIKADEAKIFKVMDDRRKLEEKAQADPRLLAILQGAGRGGAMTVGAVGGAKLLAAGASAAALSTVAGAPHRRRRWWAGWRARSAAGLRRAGLRCDLQEAGRTFYGIRRCDEGGGVVSDAQGGGRDGDGGAGGGESAAGGAGIADGFPGWRAAAGGSDGGARGRAGRRDGCGGLSDRCGGAGPGDHAGGICRGGGGGCFDGWIFPQ